MSVWIQNAYTSDIAIDCKDKVTKRQLFRVVFPSVRLDRMTGRLVSDGYTELKDEQFEALKANSLSFNKLLQGNKLIKSDKEPITSMNSADRAVALQAKLAEANERIQELEARLTELETENEVLRGSSVTVEGSTTENPDGSISAEGVKVDAKSAKATAKGKTNKPRTEGEGSAEEGK